MPAALQKTKLFPPPARAGQVERLRLLERLDSLLVEGCQAAVLSAPAGSGKTTLVAQWLIRRGMPAGWLSLDERDNLPTRFFTYLIAALRNAVPGVGQSALELLDLPGLNLEEIVILLANELAEAGGPLMLVLDDVQVIHNSALLQALDQLIAAQPPRMRLILLSREDPPLRLAARRARGQIVELRQEDLRFMLDEALAFLNQGMNLGLDIRQVKTLETKTEGWIAGLQLAALSLQRTPDVERFLSEFSGSHRFILDYLMEEVLAHRPAEVHQFLLDTAVLERLSAESCAAITQKTISETAALLDQLTRSNLFVIPLDEERRWFRYHHLFRDLLLARLGAATPTRIPELALRASKWYETNQDPRTAVEYALAAGDTLRAAELIERYIVANWKTVDLEFHYLLNRLPAETVLERPALCLQKAWLCVILGQIENVAPFVAAAERNLPAAGKAELRAFAHTLRAYLADMDNHPVRLDEELAQAYAAIPEENPGMHNSVAIIVGTIHYMEADFAGALRYFEAAAELDRRVEGTNAVPVSAMRIALMLITQGKLRQAESLLRSAEETIQRRGARRFYISGAINLLRGAVQLEWNRLEEAEKQVRYGLQLLQDWPSQGVRAMGQGWLARILVARGDLDGARQALEQADALVRDRRIHASFTQQVESAHVALWIAAGDWPALEAWAGEIERSLPAEFRFRFEARRIELCRAWLALGREREAMALLERLLEEAKDRAGNRIVILALLAAGGGEHPARAAALGDALRLGEEEGYSRTFVDAGNGLRKTLREWLAGKVGQGPQRYAQSILAAFPLEGTPIRPGTPIPAPPMGIPPVEALSAREREVLALVAEGLTNPQIASRLVISVRTVKKHVENIHGKLGVTNRTQAVARARQSGWLE
jgi:LuxR family maltose regulon positive regulatory protein